ncbi:hypothetical protein C8F01DRAFT_1224516, partial [Mycena amicta]
MPPPRPAAFVLDLPFELTSDIFERVSHTTYPMYRGFLYPNDFAPLKLASVCTQWRSVALSSPTLWATLIWDCTDRYRRHWILANTVTLLDTWLSRAGEAPLTLYFRLPREYADPIITRLLVDARRWKRLHLETHEWSLLLDNFPRELELLEYFGLYGSATVSEGRILQETTAPRLRKLCVDTYSDALHHFLPVHQLTTLVVGPLTIDDCVKLLEQTPNLRTLRLRNLTDDESSESIPPTPISLPHLTTLWWEHHRHEPSWDSSIALLQHLTLPSLTHILLHSGSKKDIEYCRAIVQSFLARSGCTIHEIMLDNANTDAIRLAAIVFPSLTALVLFIPWYGLTEESVRDLFTVAVPPLFPELRSLTIRYWITDAGVDGALLAFINLASKRIAGLRGAVKLTSFTWWSLPQAVMRRHVEELKVLWDACGEELKVPTEAQ